MERIDEKLWQRGTKASLSSMKKQENNLYPRKLSCGGCKGAR